MIRNILSKLNFDDVQNDGNGHWRMYWLVEESAQWMIWFWFGLVYLFIHSVAYVTLDTSITDYNLQHIL
jgi:hypothetical protein